jgi:Pyridoxamine 5'-phosphate oxidase
MTTESPTRSDSLADLVYVDDLTGEVCRTLLASHHVGRIAFVGHDGFPVVLPVNYTVAGDDVVVRTDRGEMYESVPLHRVAFEVDEFNEAVNTGRSLLIRGGARDVTWRPSSAAGRAAPPACSRSSSASTSAPSAHPVGWQVHPGRCRPDPGRTGRRGSQRGQHSILDGAGGHCRRGLARQGAGLRAARLAQLLTVRDLRSFAVGRCGYAPIVDDDGLLINDPVMLRVADDRFWFSIADSDVVLWVGGIAHGLGLDVSVGEPDVWPLAVQGPRAEPAPTPRSEPGSPNTARSTRRSRPSASTPSAVSERSASPVGRAHRRRGGARPAEPVAHHPRRAACRHRHLRSVVTSAAHQRRPRHDRHRARCGRHPSDGRRPRRESIGHGRRRPVPRGIAALRPRRHRPTSPGSRPSGSIQTRCRASRQLGVESCGQCG